MQRGDEIRREERNRSGGPGQPDFRKKELSPVWLPIHPPVRRPVFLLVKTIVTLFFAFIDLPRAGCNPFGITTFFTGATPSRSFFFSTARQWNLQTAPIDALPTAATSAVAMIGPTQQFANGRQMSAALGLTPRQHSSGGKDRLLGISKRGDAYLRTLLIHGARAVIRTAKGKDDRLSRWVANLAARSHPNVAAAALANKTTRIAWAMLRNGTDYQPDLVAG